MMLYNFAPPSSSWTRILWLKIVGRIQFLAQADVKVDFFQVDTVRANWPWPYRSAHHIRFVLINFLGPFSCFMR